MRPPEGVARLLRRREHGPGPVERLRRAGQELVAWRHFTTRWQRPPFERIREIDTLMNDLALFAEKSEGALKPKDPLYRDTEPARALVARVRAAEREGSRDHDELEAELCTLARSRDFSSPRRGAGVRYSKRFSRAELLAEHAAL